MNFDIGIIVEARGSPSNSRGFVAPSKFNLILTFYCEPGSSVGIATGYGLDSPGIDSQWGSEIFPIYPDRPWGPTSLLYNGYRVFSRW